MFNQMYKRLATGYPDTLKPEQNVPHFANDVFQYMLSSVTTNSYLNKWQIVVQSDRVSCLTGNKVINIST